MLEAAQIHRCIARTAALVVLAGALSLSGDRAVAHPGAGAHGRDHIAARARSAIGSPYSYGGTSPAGFDCSGFTMWVFSARGISLPHSSSAQYELGGTRGYERISHRDRLKVGDLVFHDTGGGAVGHAGIYMGRGRFISATSSEGVRVRSLYDSYWGPRWVGGVRLIDDARRRVASPAHTAGAYAPKLAAL